MYYTARSGNAQIAPCLSSDDSERYEIGFRGYTHAALESVLLKCDYSNDNRIRLRPPPNFVID